MRFCRQGTQPTGFFDEQPSERNVYPHSIPALYAYGVDRLAVKGWKVQYEKGPQQEAWAHLAELCGCRDVQLEGVRGGPAESGLPAMKIEDCKEIEMVDSSIENTQELTERSSPNLKLRNVRLRETN